MTNPRRVTAATLVLLVFVTTSCTKEKSWLNPSFEEVVAHQSTLDARARLAEQRASQTLNLAGIAAGSRIIVHLRRDAVGLAGSTPAGLDYGGPLRSALQAQGTLVQASQGWIVMDAGNNRRLCLPVDQVLAVEAVVPAEPPTP